MLTRIIRTSGAAVVLAGIAASAGILLSAQGRAPGGPEPRPIRLKATTFIPTLGERPAVPPGLAVSSYAPGQRGYYLVQFRGPILDAWKDAVAATGAELLDYVPEFAFKVRMNPGQANRVQNLDVVVWVGLFHPAYKLGPELVRNGERAYAVRIERGVDTDAAAAAVLGAGATILERDGRHLIVSADATGLDAIARIPDVADVENFLPPVKHNEFGGGLITGANLAHASGFTGLGQTIAVADTGLGDGTPWGAHVDLPAGRISGIFNWPGTADACFAAIVDDGAVDVDSGHGTHTALTALGSGGPGGEGRGTAPGASLLFQAVENYAQPSALCQILYGLVDAYYLVGIPLDLGDLFQQAYDAGARIHSDSWGSDAAGSYTTNSQDADEFVWYHPDMTITFSAGNAGVDADANGLVDVGSIGSPATAKNVVAVGASENDRQTHWECDVTLGYSPCASQGGQNDVFAYGAGWPSRFPAGPLKTDPSAGSAGQMAAFSSRGPALDGRIKPDVVAPGSWVLSGYSDRFQQGYGGTINPRNGLFQYDGWGHPLNRYYKYMGGTSMSNPIVAGAAAVIRDYYQQTRGHQASAALVKATLINSAVDLLDENNDGADDNRYPIPNSAEGWGRIDVAAATDGHRQFEDEGTGLATGGAAVYAFGVAAPGTPLKATLVWSDFPSTPTASRNLVNDLDLIVTAPDGSTTYRGNVFAGGWSQVGGAADRVNNVENVYVSSAGAGVWTVEVRGFNVPNGPQPFALVLDGDFGAPPDPPDPPDAPTNLVAAAASSTRIDLSWTDNALEETAFQVERCLGVGCADFLQIAQLGPDSVVYADEGLTTATTYTYRVRAVNAGGASGYAGPAAATTDPAPPVPGAPGNLVATASAAQVTLSWSDNSTDEDLFLVERCQGVGCGGFAELVQLPADSVAYVDSDVSVNTTYVYRVRASNAGGASAYSNEASATPGPPAAPTDLIAAGGDRQVSLAWTGVSGATSYTVLRSVTSGGGYVSTATGVTGTTYVDSGLVNGTTYYFVVRAVNAAGPGAFSNEATATPSAPTLVPPANLTATPGNQQVGLSWEASAGATSYRIRRSLTSGADYGIVTTTAATSYTDANLPNGWTFYYVVTALGGSAESGYSNEASATVGASVPGPPSNLSAVPGNGQVALTWSPVAGSGITYTVKRSVMSGSGYTAVATGLTGTTFTSTGLANGTTYYFVVTAANAIGESAPSNEASGTPGGPPAAPTGLAATPGDRNVGLTWTGVAGAASYTVLRSITSGGGYVSTATGVTGTSYVDSGLVNGTPYYYVVRAVNAAGPSAFSNEAAATPSAPLLLPPAGLTATPGHQQVSLSWAASAGATSYRVRRSLTSGANYGVVTTTAATSYTDTNLPNGWTFYYVVTALGGSAESAFSNEVSAVVGVPAPDAPAGLTVTAPARGKKTLELTWNASPGAASYTVKRSVTSGGPYAVQAAGLTTPAYTDGGLANGTTYFYVVSATGPGGESPSSSEASGSTTGKK